MATKKVKVYIDADTKGLDRGLSKASGSVGSFGKKAGGALAALASVGSLAAFGKSAMTFTTTLAKGTAQLSRTTGMDVQQSSRWVATMKTRGVEAKALNMGFVKLSQAMEGATSKGSAQAKMFKELGVSQSLIASGDTKAVLDGVSDAFAKMPDGAKKAAAAQKLFGRQSQTLMPLINNGSAALEDALAVSDKYGTTLDKNQVAKALEAAKAQREMGAAMAGIKVTVGSALIPALASGTQAVANFVAGARNGSGIGGDIAAGFSVAKSAIGDFITDNRHAFTGLLSAFSDLGRSVGVFVNAVVIPLFKKLGPSLKQTFDGWIQVLTGVVKLVSAILTGDFGKMWAAVKQIFRGALNALVGQLRRGAVIAGEVAKLIGKGIVAGIRGIGSLMLAAGKFVVSKAVDGVQSYYSTMFGIGKTVVHKVVDGVKSLGNFMYRAGAALIDRLVDGIKSLAGKLKGLGKWIGGQIGSIPIVGKFIARGDGGGDGGKAIGGSRNIIQLGKSLQGMGYAVGEHPAFGGVAPVHTPGSMHYSGRAIDVNADSMAGGEMRNLDRLYGMLRGKAGISELLWRVPGHFDHLHVAMERGGMLGGTGLRDTVPVLAAPGEAFLTRHQQVPVNTAMHATFGVGLDSVFGNARPHSAAMFGKGGKAKKAAAKTHRIVSRLQSRSELADALASAGLPVPEKLAKLIGGGTAGDRIAAIDKLLKRKGRNAVSRDDRLSLLGARSSLLGSVSDGSGSSGSGDPNQALIDSNEALIAAAEAQATAMAALKSEMETNRKFASSTHDLIQSQAYQVLQGMLKAVDRGIGGSMAESARTKSQGGFSYA